ncbi:MAG: hypothetical protein IPL46_05050 [Saprospiraceae bacterium]|nr:hypothetical protein [Saprospiraceae bacterium]
MKILNQHGRIISQPPPVLVKLISTLATKNDLVWPKEYWPAMKFGDGLKLGAVGGHGPIRYEVTRIDPTGLIAFEFRKPIGFCGQHKFEIIKLSDDRTKLEHTIDMRTEGMATLAWVFVIRWLHDALIEDAFNKIENHFSGTVKKTDWNIWVRTLRWILK